MPGRGAYVHPDLQCLERAAQRRAFPRALRVEGPLDIDQVRTSVTHVHEHGSGNRSTPTGPASAGADRE